jgi:hypothetical protein
VRTDNSDRLSALVATERLGPAATFATTEHFNLQTARAMTVAEANGRASIYLAAVSSNLIALAFIGQVSRLGATFYAFGLILLPVLAFVGAVTFKRLVQSWIEDIAFAQRIARLRAFYLTLAPELEPYMLVIRADRLGSTQPVTQFAPSGRQLALTTAGMIGVVNSVVVAGGAGLLLRALGAASLPITIGFGAAIGLAALSLHHRHHLRACDRYIPEAVDQAAIYVPAAPQVKAA